ncbi:amine oxidase, partial [Calocera cornea HHB12733]
TQVLILGGGMTGLTAAYTLASQHNLTNYTIVEAQPFLGGRLYSVPFGLNPDTGGPYIVEAGANWVHGLANNATGAVNPIWSLVQQFGLETSRSEDGIPPAFGRAGQVDVADAWGEWTAAWGRFLDLGRERQHRGLGDMTARAGLRIAGWEPSDYVHRSVEFWNFDMESQQSPDESSWFEIANNHYYTYHDFSDEEYLVHDPRGYVTVATGPYHSLPLAKQGKLLLGAPVTELHYSPDGVEARLQDGSILNAEYAICTFSVGVLQSKAVSFHPPLPRWKSDAIDGFSMSTYTKIFLQFSTRFWPATEYQLHASSRRGYYTQFQSLDAPGVLEGSHVLFTTLTDEESVRVEGLTDAEVQEEVLDVLRGMYGTVNVSDVTAFYFHRRAFLALEVAAVADVEGRWNSNPYTRGSYSNWPASYLPASQKNLRAALDARLLFAGEATSYEYLGFLQGAHLEGRKAAESVAHCLAEEGKRGCLGQDWFEDILAGQGTKQQWQRRGVDGVE